MAVIPATVGRAGVHALPLRHSGPDPESMAAVRMLKQIKDLPQLRMPLSMKLE